MYNYLVVAMIIHVFCMVFRGVSIEISMMKTIQLTNNIAKHYIAKQRNGFLGLFWSNNPE
jgi:hypothetical protein